MMRIIVDTNLWISFLISRSFPKLESVLRHRRATLLVSKEFLQELRDVARRPKLAKYYSAKDFEQLLELLAEIATEVDVSSTVSFCRDPKDDYLLALARDGRADYLLTGDKDLLTLENFEGTRICTITDFLDKHALA